MSLTIQYIFRRKLPNYHSIEELFEKIILHLNLQSCTEVLELPRSGASPGNLIKNLLFSRNKSIKDAVHHITGDVHYIALVTGSKTVLTIHDVKSIIKGSVFKKFFIKLLWFWIPALLVKRITVISNFSRRELEEVIPFAKHKIRVVYNPVNEQLKETPYIHNEGVPNILLMGTKPNKNLERSLMALKDLKCKLTIIGKLSTNQKELLQNFKFSYENFFDISYPEIIKAYQNCDLVLFPSTYEGFGMPIIEAQAIGRPVITSNFGAMKEVAGEKCCLVDPYDVLEIEASVNKILVDSNYRNEVISSGLENVKRFELSRVCQNYLDIYQEINKET